MNGYWEKSVMTGKNLRLLGIERPPAWQPDIREMISELECELGKGESVYTSTEMEKLAQKLTEYETMLERLNSH